jgi:acetyl-CoA carboxylase biotin carboxylase subunit/3-methylcrotonyl-CoA carboxylase alpha subunit
VKAAAGGGGIGMQIAQDEAQLLGALATCRARSAAAFGDDRLYLERYLANPRHIEVQVMADAQGQARAVGDRECSVQRRHQKVIEEAPAPPSGLPEALRTQIYQEAERLIAAAGLVGVATVEFIAEAGEIFFLEVNARLQVEHPITEALTGLDLVEVQFGLARGLSVEQCLASRATPLGRAAIEVRLYAEDPSKGFVPQPGKVEQLSWTPQPWLRVDAGYEAGDSISHFYDPLIAKVITWADDRTTAIERMKTALGGCELLLVGPKGAKNTNLTLLPRLLEAPDFAAGTYDTHLIERVMAT